MARRRSAYSQRGGYASARPRGLERALQHIEDAKNLSIELGGTDTDVKEYFFSLPRTSLDKILEEYGQNYGNAARSYAEETIPKWRTGSVKMSGMVAERLFNLLPPRMPIEKKYELTENLWRKLGPRSNQTITVGINASLEDIMVVINSSIQQSVVSFGVPEQIEKRFSWLSSGDVQVKQTILNHLQEMEKESVVNGSRIQLPLILEHLRQDSQTTKSATQTLVIGNHQIRLEFETDYDGVTLGSRRKASGPSSEDSGKGWLVFVVIAIAIALALLAMNN